MRIFQNFGLLSAYRSRLYQLASDANDFNSRCAVFLNDRFGAMHLLDPVFRQEADAFFTNGDDAVTQGIWAKENGLPYYSSLEDILLAQIEHHRTEVFYNLDPVRFDTRFLRRLPGSVRHRIAWRAAPYGGADFSDYNLMLCNFPSILEGFRRNGLRAEWFSPAHDPELEHDPCAERKVDIAFIGTYSRHHTRRAALIEAIADMAGVHSVALHLDSTSRFLQLAESPIGLIGLRRHRRPNSVRQLALGPVFGRDLYRVLKSARIVVNGAIDMSGCDRGNMRCWEGLGAGALLISDAGRYPPGMIDNETMLTYQSIDDAIALIRRALANSDIRTSLAAAGQQMLRNEYSRERVFSRFEAFI